MATRKQYTVIARNKAGYPRSIAVLATTKANARRAALSRLNKTYSGEGWKVTEVHG